MMAAMAPNWDASTARNGDPLPRAEHEERKPDHLCNACTEHERQRAARERQASGDCQRHGDSQRRRRYEAAGWPTQPAAPC